MKYIEPKLETIKFQERIDIITSSQVPEGEVSSKKADEQKGVAQF